MNGLYHMHTTLMNKCGVLVLADLNVELMYDSKYDTCIHTYTHLFIQHIQHHTDSAGGLFVYELMVIQDLIGFVAPFGKFWRN